MTAVCSSWNRRALFVAVACLLLFFWPHVYIFSSVAYTYLYWINPSLNWAAPVNVEVGQTLPVPAIIHQTWKDKEVPEKWKAAQQSCIDLHTPDYEYRLWTDADGLELIKTEYPWFLPTYLSYPYDIQRVDAVRYFILHKYGGIYIDLDMGCKKRLDFMRVANYTGPLTYPVGVSNDVMAARPGDVFMERAIHQLSRWNRWLFIKYVQVMFSTGPMFLTVQYAIAPRRIRNDVAVIPPPTYGKYDVTGDPAFYHLHGSSWHADDAAFVFWLDKYRGLLFAAGIAGVLVGLAAWELRRRRITQRSGARENFDLEKNF